MTRTAFPGHAGRVLLRLRWRSGAAVERELTR